MGEVDSAVRVKNAGISYRSHRQQQVFLKVNLNVPVGTVYGLLGPSGCGKTSLIRCILGRQDLDEGSISLFGHCPGTAASGVPGPLVGYMPQETCIPKTLTIAQCWTYYGTILGMSKKQLNEAIGYFIQLLNLPPANTPNSQLSGGELRRVSFATALIHEPKLLLLDEPTVGIDCITKKNMWEHLLKLANEKHTSIILTTHYIEEARAAHKVGLMNDGSLVVEDYTENLLRRFNCESLEGVFLNICSKSCPSFESDKNVTTESTDVWVPTHTIKPEKNQNVIPVDATDYEQDHIRKYYKRGGLRSLSLSDFGVRPFVLQAIVLRNWLHLYRFPGLLEQNIDVSPTEEMRGPPTKSANFPENRVLIFVLLFPCVQLSCGILSFKEVVGPAKFGLVNKDSGDLGDQYLSHLADDFIYLQSFESDSSALEALRGGQVRGLIVIRQNFSDAYLDRISNSPLVTRRSINSSIISITLDSTDVHVHFLRLHLVNAFERFLFEMYNATALGYLLARPVIYFDKVAVDYISIPRNLKQSISAVAMVMFLAPTAVAVLTLFVDINYGHLERSVVAGVTSAEIVLGLLVILMACAIVQLVLLLITAFLLSLHILSWSSFFLLFVVLYAHGLCGMGVGIFLSLICNHVYVLLILSGYICLFASATTGGFWPLTSVPYYFRWIFMALPQAYPVRAITAIYLGRAFYVSEMLCSLSLSLAYTVGFISLSMILLKIKT